jgi:hypothetical protein
VEKDLLGHLLKANDPATQRAVEQRLASDAAAVHDLARLRAALSPLEADRVEFEPPSGLWARTLAQVAEHIVATEGPASRPEDARTEDVIRRAAAVADSVFPPRPAAPITPAPPPSEGGLPPARRWNVIAMVGLSLSLLALILPAVLHVRERSHQLACNDSMRQFYQAAVGYTDNHDGNFPRVPDGLPAAAAAQALQQAGYLRPDDRFTCPSAPPDATATGALATYAYTLGFRDEFGQLRGLDRAPGYDLMPILADAPGRQGATAYPINHRRGQNVLYAGGNVRFCTTSTVGVNADDIFINQNGQVGAGVSREDTVLGRPEERP